MLPFAFVNLSKAAGPSSTQAGVAVRRVYQRFFNEQGYAEKLALGHFGTLDPLAEGVLPLALGKATRLFPLIENRSKRYAFTLVLGTSMSTGDEAGTVGETAAVPSDAAHVLQGVLAQFIGDVSQIPPMASALKHEGKRLYELAREDIVVERAPRSITIHALEYLGVDEACSAAQSTLALRLRVHCSEGTYVRTLCEDLAKAIGTVGHMRALLREAAGPFELAATHTLEEIEADPQACLLDPLLVMPFPVLELQGEALQRFRHGQPRLLKESVLDAAELIEEEHLSRTVFVTSNGKSAGAIVGLGVLLGRQLVPRSVFT